MSNAERIARPVVPEMDELLNVTFPVLDAGHVRLVDYMGGDAAVVQAARVSYGAGTKSVREDRGLIRYLMRNRHTTPFEMCELKLHIKAPMDCWRQWVRHRTASINEYSTRYSEAIDGAQHTSPYDWRRQSTSNRQGSGSHLEPAVGEVLTSAEAGLQNQARKVYEARLEAGVAREQARKDLPLSTYTEAYWKIDLHNLLHFLGLRMDSHAQHEIRSYATTIGMEIVAKWVPWTWDAFMEYRFSALYLTEAEQDLARRLANGIDISVAAKSLPKRELTEAKEKLQSLGLKWPTVADDG